MRVVLDTNVLLVAIPFHTPYYPIFRSFLNGEFSICVTTDILSEYSPDLVQVTNYFFWNLITTDPDDNKFVDCAITAGADFIVTNDQHFAILKMIDFPSIHVISAEDFVEMLSG